jgi:aspartyl-tRNA(Asn)/glutamyl-tRNA(Gln) amidotransferase subunit C
MKISREEVLRVAELAHLELSDAEVTKYQQQIDSILEYIAKLNVLDTSDVEPMAQVITGDAAGDPSAMLREDVVVPCDVAREILKQAPDAEGPYFRVPKVIER